MGVNLKIKGVDAVIVAMLSHPETGWSRYDR